jgi:hypothetical protein
MIRLSAPSKIKASLLVLAAMLVSAPALHASSITYDLTLTDSNNTLYSGYGTVTFSVAPTQTYTNYSSDVTALSFTIDGTTFNLSDPGASLTAFEFSSLSPTATIRDITFSDQIGTSNRLALQSTSDYVYSYDNETQQAIGVFGPATLASAAPTPEPNSIILLGTGLLAGAGELYRRAKLIRA